MTDFQSEFVFGLQGKRYQDFITDIAMPEISKVLGTNDYEVVGFDGHLSFKDFENKKNSIASHIYMIFLCTRQKISTNQFSWVWGLKN